MLKAILAALFFWPALAAGAAFQTTTSLPQGFYGHVTVAYNSFLYKIGGIPDPDGVTQAGQTVYMAAIHPDGTLGAWQQTTSLPTNLFFHTGTVVNGFIYVMGGQSFDFVNGFVTSNKTYYARIQSDGTVGVWNPGPNIPQAISFPSATSSVNWNGVIYITGGLTDVSDTNTVYYTTVNPDGSMAGWTATTPLPVGLYTHTTVEQGFIYVIGGSANNGSTIVNTVYRAKINSDKTLGAWTQVTSLPRPLTLHGSQLWGNTVYVSGGFDGSNVVNTVYTNIIQSDGSLGVWISTDPMPHELKQHGMTAASNFLYITGGQDNAGNIQSTVYFAPLPPVAPPPPTDALPPRTTLSAGAPNFAGTPEFVSPSTLLTLTAVDDLTTVGDAKGTGVQSTQWSLDSSAFQNYGAPFAIGPDGLHWVRFFSTDKVGNTEATEAAQFAVDGTAPISTVTAGSPKAILGSGDVVVSSLTSLTISAIDPPVNGVASGVNQVLYSVDGAPMAPAAGTFKLPAADGSHTVRTQATDHLQNAEAAHNSTIYVDATAPNTTISAAPSAVSINGASYLNAGALITFSANDPVAGGVAAGVHHTEYSLDGGAAAVFTGGFGLPEGAHTIVYRSFDNVGNAEASKSASYSVDSTPPVTTLAAGFGTTLFGIDVVTPATTFTLSAQDPPSNGVASGVARILYNVDGGADQTYGAAFQLPAGFHTLNFGAVDNAGNAEVRRMVSVSVSNYLADAMESLGSVSLSGQVTVNGNIRSDAAFSGVQNAVVNGNVTAMTISLAGTSKITGSATQGQATVSGTAYNLSSASAFAQSNNNNAAIPAQYLVNGALVLSSGQLTLADGNYYVAGISVSGGASIKTANRANIFSHGPLNVSGGGTLNSGAGADNLWIVQDSGSDVLSGQTVGAFNLFAPNSPVSLSGNGAFSGRLFGASISVINAFDSQPPRTTLSVGAPNFGANPQFVTPGTPLTLAAVDDGSSIGDGRGSGVAATYWSLDTNAFQIYAAPFTVGPDGTHWVRYYSVDAVGNIEATQSIQLAVDGTIPVSTATIGSPQAVLGSGAIVVSPRTQASASAYDPVVNGSASGIAQVSYGIDGGAFSAAGGSFALPSSDGPHTIHVLSLDNLGQSAAAFNLAFYTDATAPATTIQTAPSPVVVSETAYLPAAALVSFTAADPVVGGVAAGVNHTEFSLDGAAASTYSGAFGLAEGAHTISYRSFDNVGNAETAKTAAYSVDATPPITTLTVGSGASLFGIDLVTSDTLFTLTANDPVSNGAASGVARTVYNIDGGADQSYTAPFHLTSGNHTINFRSTDNAGNSEITQSASVSVGTFLSDTMAAYDSINLANKAGVNGTVRTNGSVDADNKSFINGDVYAMTVTASAKAIINGAIHQGRATLPAVSYELAAAAAWAQTHNNNASIPSRFLVNGALVLDSRSPLILADGNYYFTAVWIKGRSSLTAENRANIFIDGTVTYTAGDADDDDEDRKSPARSSLKITGNGKINDSGDANNVWIVMSNGDVELSGHARGAFNLYAPASTITLSGHDLYAGRLFGKTVRLTGQATQASNSTLPPPSHHGSTHHFAKHDDDDHGDGKEGHGHVGDHDVPISWSDLSNRAPHSHDADHQAKVPAPTQRPPVSPSYTLGGSSSGCSASKPNTNLSALSHGNAVVHLPVPPTATGGGTSTGANTGDKSQPVRLSALNVANPTQIVTAAAITAASIPIPPLAPGNTSASTTTLTAKATKPPFQVSLPKVAAFAQVPPSGGVVAVEGHASISIPDQASSGLKVTVSRHTGSDGDEPKRLASIATKGLAAASPGTDFGPEGTQFARPVTLTLAYDRTLLPAGMPEDNLAIYYWNTAKQDWEAFPSTIDKIKQTVSAPTSHFSLYRVLAGNPTAAAAPGIAPFALGSVYSFPNPATHGDGPTLHVEAGSADSVDIRIYDMSGALVHSVSVSGPAASIDDGSGRGPVPAFEYKWDVHGVGSGVYIYLITANKGGAGSLKTKGKIVVIK